MLLRVQIPDLRCSAEGSCQQLPSAVFTSSAPLLSFLMVLAGVWFAGALDGSVSRASCFACCTLKLVAGIGAAPVAEDKARLAKEPRLAGGVTGVVCTGDAASFFGSVAILAGFAGVVFAREGASVLGFTGVAGVGNGVAGSAALIGGGSGSGTAALGGV